MSYEWQQNENAVKYKFTAVVLHNRVMQATQAKHNLKFSKYTN